MGPNKKYKQKKKETFGKKKKLICWGKFLLESNRLIALLKSNVKVCQQHVLGSDQNRNINKATEKYI